MYKYESFPKRLKNTKISFPLENPEPTMVPKIRKTHKKTFFIRNFMKTKTKIDGKRIKIEF